jgi:hypothetical protein
MFSCAVYLGPGPLPVRSKGLVSLNVAINHSNHISKTFVQPDPGLLNDSYDLMLNLVRLRGLNLQFYRDNYFNYLYIYWFY